jgi:GNAT superfamily N-acetyltransferase
MRIEPLLDWPQHVALATRWGFDEWGHLRPGNPFERRLERVRASLQRDKPPAILIAVDDGGAMLGMASLIFDDLEGDPRNPWLASVYTPPEHRGKGIASALVRAVEDLARRLGYHRFYLFTTSQAKLYAALGWRALEDRDYRGERITVMERDL